MWGNDAKKLSTFTVGGSPQLTDQTAQLTSPFDNLTNKNHLIMEEWGCAIIHGSRIC